jgi:hypothetical protein
LRSQLSSGTDWPPKLPEIAELLPRGLRATSRISAENAGAQFIAQRFLVL